MFGIRKSKRETRRDRSEFEEEQEILPYLLFNLKHGYHRDTNKGYRKATDPDLIQSHLKMYSSENSYNEYTQPIKNRISMLNFRLFGPIRPLGGGVEERIEIDKLKNQLNIMEKDYIDVQAALQHFHHGYNDIEKSIFLQHYLGKKYREKNLNIL